MISQSAAAVDLNVDAGTFYVDTTNNRVGVGGKTDPDTPLHVIGTVTATTFAGSGASLTSIPNSALVNSSITINSTAVSLGGSLTLTTANIAENTNLYYTDARADARIAAADTDDLSEGSSNLYYTDARVDARVSGGSLGNITTTGYIRGPATFTLDPAAHGDNTGTVVIAGNLQVDGTQTVINSTTLTVDDKNITLASGSANAAAASGAGFTVDIGTGTNPAITYDGTNDEWDFNKALNVTGGIEVSGQSAFNYGLTSIVSGNTSQYPLDIGSTGATNFVIQRWQTSYGYKSFIIAYGSQHSSEAGNFAIKNTQAGKDIFFQLAGSVVPLRLTSTGATFAGNITVGGTVDGIDIAARDAVLTSTTTTAGAALPKAGGTMTGNLTVPNLSITSTNWLGFGDYGERISGSNGNSSLSFYTDATVALTLDSSQNATFAGTIDSGAITSSGVVTATGTDTQQYRILQGTAVAGGIFKERTITGAGVSNDVSIFAESISDGGEIHFMTGGSATKRATIDATGNVGIGTSAPDTLLELRKDTASGGYGAYPTLSLRNDNAAGYSAIHFQEGSTQRARVEVGNNSGTPYMGLYTTSAASGITIKGGKVGIGTTSPAINKGSGTASALHLYTAAAAPELRIQRGNGTDFSITASTTGGGANLYSSHGMTFHTNSTTRAVDIDTSGNVGIGASSPKRLMHLNNAAALTTKIQITNLSTGSSTDGDGFQIGISNDGTANIEQRENLDLIFSTNNTERMRINSDGHLLVGVTNGSADVGGTTTGIRLGANGQLMASGSGTGTYNYPAYFDRRGTDNTGDSIALGLHGFLKSSIGVIGTSAGSDDGGITFNTWANNVTRTTKMTIFNSVVASEVNIAIKNGKNLELQTTSGVARGYISAQETNTGGTHHAGLIIATSGGENITFKDSGIGGDTNMVIDGSGEVTMPNQPRFLAYGASTGYTPTSYSQSVKFSTVTNTSGHYSTTTGLFTAPVAGAYLFQGSIYSTAAASGGWQQAWLTINGARGDFTDIAGNGMDTASIISTTHLVDLAVGDTVGYHPYTGSGTFAFHTNVHHTWFKGRLLG